MSAKTGSTIGFERRFNPAPQLRDRAAFVDFIMRDLPPKPPQFEKIVGKNRGLIPLHSAKPRPYAAREAWEAVQRGECVVDLRDPGTYGESHIPGALNVWIESPQFAERVAWAVPPGVPLLLLAPGPRPPRGAQGRALRGGAPLEQGDQRAQAPRDSALVQRHRGHARVDQVGLPYRAADARRPGARRVARPDDARLPWARLPDAGHEAREGDQDGPARRDDRAAGDRPGLDGGPRGVREAVGAPDRRAGGVGGRLSGRRAAGQVTADAWAAPSRRSTRCSSAARGPSGVPPFSSPRSTSSSSPSTGRGPRRTACGTGGTGC